MSSLLSPFAEKCLCRVILLALVLAAIGCAQVESLPAPVAHGNSFEILSNSRYSVHSGFASTLPRQVLANILWAMNRVPLLGSYREIYIATPTNVYLYDSTAHALVVHLAGNHRYNSGSSFEVGIACTRNEEAGYAIQAGLLAGEAFWDSSGGDVVSCPMQFATNYANSNWQPNHPIMMVDVFGQMTATGLTSVCQAVSSDSSLPQPQVRGSDTFEVLVSGLHQDSLFDPANLPIDAVSQLLWAGDGVTPHHPIGKRGLTIPSAVANYYLTRKVYLVADTAVMRYNNRLPPGNGLSTSDHRLELVMSGDQRIQLRAASPGIPNTAPVYIVACVADTSPELGSGSRLCRLPVPDASAEPGLAGLVAPIAPPSARQSSPRSACPWPTYRCWSSPAAHPPTGVTEQPQILVNSLSLRVVGNRAPIRIEYSLGTAVAARLTILDLAGRLVRSFDLAPQVSGALSLDWDGKDESGRLLPAGIYVCRLEARRGGQHRARRAHSLRRVRKAPFNAPRPAVTAGVMLDNGDSAPIAL